MGEECSIKMSDMPRTRESIKNDLIKIGLKPDMVVIVHSSLSSMGWVCGGAVAVIQALMDVITPEGTIVMPAHSGEYSEPSYWGNPPVPAEWCQVIRDTMPAFEPEITPTRGIGIIAETFRKWPGVLRSSHPQVSFCAWGKHAKEIIENHSLNYGLGEQSPLAHLYDLDGWVLLLGVGYENNTSFHLSEYRAPCGVACTNGAPVVENGHRVWKTIEDIEIDSDTFGEIGAEFEKKNYVLTGLVGSAKTRLFPQRKGVDFASAWLEEYRKAEKP
jgi:Aminoglycoside N3''-acetyltransferase